MRDKIKALLSAAGDGWYRTATAVSDAGTVRLVLLALALMFCLGGCCGGCACSTAHRWTN